MEMGFPILTVLAVLPGVGAASLIFLRGALAKQVALAVSVLALLLAVVLALQFDIGGGMQFSEQAPWIAPLGAYYALGLDGIGLTLVLLVAIVTPVVIMASWRDFDAAALPSAEPAPSSEERALSLSQAGAAGPSTGAGGDLSKGLGRDPLRGSGSTLAPGSVSTLAPRYGLHVFFSL